jgi:hypothetical protein
VAAAAGAKPTTRNERKKFFFVRIFCSHLRIESLLSQVMTDGRTDGRTDDGRT